MTPTELRDARKALGLTQKGLARALGMGRWGWQSISAMEGGRQPVSDRTAAAINALLAAK